MWKPAAITIGLVVAVICNLQAPKQEPETSAEPVQALLTDSCVVLIDHSPDDVWNHIKT